MSPAKMFAYMKKREMGAGRPDARRACNSTRHRLTASQCASVGHLLDFTPAFLSLYSL